MSIELKKVEDYVWEIPKAGRMRVPGRIYTNEKLMEALRGDESPQQVANVAHLPGIVRYSLAMPDIHYGYGFPIGGVAATDPLKDGVISPGGVGFDINCGIRLAATNLSYDEVKERLEELVNLLYHSIPSGVGSSGAIRKLSVGELKELMVKGAQWALEQGFGLPEDLEHTEENGRMDGADPDAVSKRAIERGLDQAGTLGSGNHFLEIGVVEEVYNPALADALGLWKGQVVVWIHTGSRGFGHQVCDDYLQVMQKAVQKYGIDLPDRQLACAPVNSKEGQDYLGAMRCAANYAFANRQIIMDLVRKAWQKAWGISPSELGLRLVYDVAHNIAKIEKHIVDGQERMLCVHRKGATRAFPPGHPEVPEAYREVGQPVLVPGDMGTESYVLVGTQKAMEETFGSTCHGAGRVMSRAKAKKQAKRRDLRAELEGKGIVVRARGWASLAEEMPDAYKDVGAVVDVVHRAGLSRKVARTRPIGVVKG
ncbi:MAG: RNA-splicing ligase RtcB [Candidatus Latescibacterota bacterium]|nr:MAG: RNA-splicing ligase RtcB [Candidatus Latescibacterota bacterium]